MPRGKRKSNNPDGRPVTVGPTVKILLALQPVLARGVALCAEAEGKTVTEWLRVAAHERTLRQAAGDRELLRRLNA